MYKAIFSPPKDQFTASPRAGTAKPGNHKFHKTVKKDQTPKKVRPPRQERTRTHGNERRADSCPPAHPQSHTECAAHGTEYFHWVSWAACLALLPPISCTPAHWLNTGDWKKSLIS